MHSAAALWDLKSVHPALAATPGPRRRFPKRFDNRPPTPIPNHKRPSAFSLMGSFGWAGGVPEGVCLRSGAAAPARAGESDEVASVAPLQQRKKASSVPCQPSPSRRPYRTCLHPLIAMIIIRYEAATTAPQRLRTGGRQSRPWVDPSGFNRTE